ERAEPRGREGDDVRWFPRDRDGVGDQRGRDTRGGGVAAADRNRARHQRPRDRDYEPFPPRDAAEPRLELGPDGEGGREHEVELDRVDPEAAGTQKARA